MNRLEKRLSLMSCPAAVVRWGDDPLFATSVIFPVVAERWHPRVNHAFESGYSYQSVIERA